MGFRENMNYSAVGGIGMLSGGATTVSAMMNGELNNIALFANAASTGLTQAEKDAILANLAIAQATLNGGIIQDDTAVNDKPEYSTFYVLKAKDLAGNEIVYKFYYNEVADQTPEEDGENADLAPETQLTAVEKPVEEEEELEVHIKGIVVVGKDTYDLVGDKETTVESDGSKEEEVEFVISMNGEKVIIKQEVEVGPDGTEKEFEFIHEDVDGNVVSKSEVEYETNETGEVEMEFETLASNGTVMEYSYEFVTIGGKDLIKVEFENVEDLDKTVEIEIIKDETTGEVIYKFLDDVAEPQEPVEPAPAV